MSECSCHTGHPESNHEQCCGHFEGRDPDCSYHGDGSGPTPLRHHVRKAREYNYFRVMAVNNLLELLGVEHPTNSQLELANRVVEHIERYGASKH